MARAWLAPTLLFGPALVWSLAAGLGLAWTASDEPAWADLERHGDPVAGSSSCRGCHPAQWRSWHDSWHRTMTQQPARGHLAAAERALIGPGGATGQAGVLAPFAGEQLDYGGFRATMDRGDDGAPRVLVQRLDDAGESVVGPPVLDVAVTLTVGSHRYQQYVAELGRGDPAGLGTQPVGATPELWRLPVAWHRAEQRWIHMNGAFVEPEGEPGSLPDYERHLSRWNDNCIFCHNTEPVPGRGADTPGFRTRVGELGIACEACHGPATAHLERHLGNPLRRLLASATPGTDGSIANPSTLGPARESEICGRCHGQRIARDIAKVMRDGDGFVAGDQLADISRPIFADSTIEGAEGLDHGRPFAARFWPDGTPRLSAYEYQGLLLSPCWDPVGDDGLGCGHCHDMHGATPDGQPRAGRTGEGACVGCHSPDTLGGAARAGGHGGHAALRDHERSVDCVDCHMPRVTYGLLEGMVSHRITSPDPAALLGRADQPDACTQCHVDRSRAWAAASMPALGLRGSPVDPSAARPEEALASRVVLDLLGGDPIQRNLAAHALARPDATGSIEARMAWIAEGLEDEYPSVRWFAWRGLRSLVEQLDPETGSDTTWLPSVNQSGKASASGREALARAENSWLPSVDQSTNASASGREALLEALAQFDYLGPIDARVEVITRVRALVGPAPLAEHPDLHDRLTSDRWGLAIWIGE
ncbi:ammonia-forming cytochrome c nitrite reductase subunit c552 [Enhygromyxa salina]|nr:ammonia-forming cytochrome c nitrite reductase subunit c552 [Enhygromyxa salina]